MTEPNEPTELADDATDDEIVEFNQEQPGSCRG